MSVMTLYIGSDNTLELRELTNTVTDEYVSDATVEATLTTTGGAEVAGETWPVTLAHVEPAEGAAESGKYRVTLSDALEMTEGAFYIVTVVATIGAIKRTFKQRIEAVYG